MTAPPFSGSLLRWISHQRAMSCRTRLRVDCDLGTLPVNVRTSRAPSLSMIRQCRKATSKGSSFFSEKSTLNIGLGVVSLILPPHCVRSSWSVYHSHWRSIRFADAVLGQADTAQPLYLSCVASAPARLSERRILTNRPLGFVTLTAIPTLAVSLPFGFCGGLHPFPAGQAGKAHLLQSRGSHQRDREPLLQASTRTCRSCLSSTLRTTFLESSEADKTVLVLG
jgi:hypothetical protein